MAKTAVRVQDGAIIDVIVGADVNGGDPINYGTRVGIASTGALAGESVAMELEGVFEFTAVTADTIAYGTKLYLDNVSGTDATTVATSNQVIGYATTEKAGAVAGKVNIKLGA
jgi:predicted RecA/RadA family phage recombinase